MVKRIFILLLALFSFITSVNYGQINNLKIKINGAEKTIPVLLKNGVILVPVNEMAEALHINYYYNKAKQKTELKFDSFKLKFTADNPFVVKTKKGENDFVHQMPAATVLADGKIFIPLEHVLNQLESGINQKLNFNKALMVLSLAKGKKTAEIPVAEKEKQKEEVPEISESENGVVILNEKANGTLVSIKFKKKKVKYESVYKNNVLTLTLKNGPVRFDEVNNIPDKSVVKEVRFKQNGRVQSIQFELSKEYDSHEITSNEDGSALLLTIRNKIFVKKNNQPKRGKWDFDVIVIDAGHGGKDYGAIGINGLCEKDVNLAIALKLGKMIENNIKGVKVVYTRKNDTFVELDRRGKIANEKGGKLFISIHCNSTPKKPTDATGAEFYLLRPGRTESAIKIAERENSVIKYEDNPSRYKKLTDENFILVSMAHSSYMKYSEKFSDYLNTNFMNVPQLKSRGVKQAGFYVLVGASMPGVLVESGFISNRNDAKMLGSSEGQSKIANSIYDAIKKFKDYYDKVIETES